MKRSFFLFLSIILIGGGCATSPQQSGNRQTAWKELRGIDLIMEAQIQSGAPVVVYRPSLGRRFRSTIAPTFTDYNGSYRMSDGSSIELQMGVKGTPEKDREQFKQLPSLSSFEEGELNNWEITTAYDEERSRWVLRATQRDLGFQDDGYHVIECLAVTDSNFVFWDGCRTVLENAQIVADAI